MATGIVSAAASVQGLPLLSEAFFAIATGAWAALAAARSLALLRGRAGRPSLQAFAAVAATAVIATRLAIAGRVSPGLALWALASLIWLGLLVRRPAVERPRGASLLIVVATESLAVPPAILAAHRTDTLLPVSLVAWAFGLLLYPLVLAAIARARRPGDFAPDLWIVMGALAIATLAGSELVLAAGAGRALPGVVRHVVGHVDVVTWTLASLLIPALAGLELTSRRGWRYDAYRWSFVFPLGMYSVASRTVARAEGIGFAVALGRVFFAFAVAAWALALLGWCRQAAGAARPSAGRWSGYLRGRTRQPTSDGAPASGRRGTRSPRARASSSGRRP
jgi:tellurite resistance protein TehA-like permease